MKSHKEIKRTRQYRQFDDCNLYKIHCSCGKECGGWTPVEAEEEFKKHLDGVKP